MIPAVIKKIDQRRKEGIRRGGTGEGEIEKG
jgi:hypothetical protein